MEKFEIDIAKSLVDSFIQSLNLYKKEHGESNIEVLDSLGHNIQRIRPNKQLVELIYHDNDQQELSRFIHYTHFDLRIRLISEK